MTVDLKHLPIMKPKGMPIESYSVVLSTLKSLEPNKGVIQRIENKEYYISRGVFTNRTETTYALSNSIYLNIKPKFDELGYKRPTFGDSCTVKEQEY